MCQFVNSKKPLEVNYANDEALVPLILDGISQLLDNGHNMPRDYNKTPLNHNEIVFIIQNLHEELADPRLPAGLIYLYGKILDYLKEITPMH